MKKFLLPILAIICVVCLTGCGKETSKSVTDKLSKKMDKTSGYKLEAEMELINNEDSYKYDVSVSYKKKDNYRVSLRNKTNNHEQIILKNKDGVYVVTPSLNKSFKFQSSWPENSSQTYILSSVLNDLIGTEDKKYTEENNFYVLTSSVNYPNNNKLSYQKLYFDKEINLKKIEVFDNSDTKCIIFNINSIDYKAALDDDYFDLSKVVDGNTTEESSETSSFNSYAKDEFNDNEQIRLKKFCSKLDALGHTWILSNSDVKGKNENDNFFDDLYSDFNIQRVDARRNINANPEKRGKLTELLITNQTNSQEYVRAI